MKITIDFENGMRLDVKPEHLNIADAVSKEGVPTIAITFKTDTTLVPFLFFTGQRLATKEELAATAKKPGKAAKENTAA